MSKYLNLLNNKPKIKIGKNVNEVIFTTISCMCDNEHNLRLKRNENNEFKFFGYGQSLTNWQMKFKPFEIEWKADKNKWNEVIEMINTGTSKIEKAISR